MFCHPKCEEEKKHKIPWSIQYISDKVMEFKCDQCDLKYKNTGRLNRHHNAKHKMIRYICDKCDAHYNSNYGLHQHKREKHEGKTLKCARCDFHTGVFNGIHKIDKVLVSVSE